MKQKKGLIIGLIVAFLAVFAVASVMGYRMFRQVRHKQAMNVLTAELNKMEGAISNQAFTEEESAQILDRTVSQGEYAVVERGVKDHYKDLVARQKEMVQYLGQDELSQFITTEALLADAPNFETTIQKLGEFRATEQKLRDSFLYLTSEEGVRQYQPSGLKGDLQKVFDNYVTEITSANMASMIEGNVASYNQTMDAIGQVLDYLKTNQSSWIVENGQILFKTQESLDAFNEITNQIPQ